jgi:tRNA(Ile2) C34 agmatinyltransferase TiaS
MTNEEAINWIRLDIEMAKFDPSTGEEAYLNEDAKKVIEAQEKAIEALKKQVPKKVRITTSTKRCSVCGRQLSSIGNIHPERNYCQSCGQAIDWTEGEE